jgi:hypothetical protein
MLEFLIVSVDWRLTEHSGKLTHLCSELCPCHLCFWWHLTMLMIVFLKSKFLFRPSFYWWCDLLRVTWFAMKAFALNTKAVISKHLAASLKSLNNAFSFSMFNISWFWLIILKQAWETVVDSDYFCANFPVTISLEINENQPVHKLFI